MTRPQREDTPRRLTLGEQRALASFLAGRLPAGQLDAELARARGGDARSDRASGLRIAA